MSKKIKPTTSELLKSITVNLTAYIKRFRYHAARSSQYTKSGPGRVHKQGKAIYIPRTPEVTK